MKNQRKFFIKAIIGLSFLIHIFFFSSLAIFSEDDFSTPFYLDLAGYFGVGKAESGIKEEALRLAKSAAIKKIFSEIGKDELFQQMFISSYPQFIIVDASKVDESGEKDKIVYKATVKVKIDQTAIILQEDQYAYSVGELLNKAEKKIEEAETFLKTAENSELNLRMSDAMMNYRSAEIRCGEIKELVKNIKDANIKSDKDRNILIIQQITGTLLKSAEGGLKRLKELESEIEKDSALQELVKTFELMLKEVATVAKTVEKYSPGQPFYDLPKSNLENILIDLKSALDKTKTIDEKLLFLRKQIPDERLLLKEKLELTIGELKNHKLRLNKMKKDVELEIRDPRLSRQERARKLKEILSKSGDVTKYIFLHKPADVLSFRWYIPVEWPMEHTPRISENAEIYLRAEKTFQSGFWIRAQLDAMTKRLLNGNALKFGSQELALGYHRNNLLFGTGLTWDWWRSIDSTALDKTTALKLYFGGVDPERTRATWLLSFDYELPRFADPFVVAYHLNLTMDLLIRIEDVMVLETALETKSWQNEVITGPITAEDMEYGFNWYAAIGIRLPSPFLWGVCFNLDERAPILPAGGTGEFSGSSYWGAFIEYSF